MTAKISASADGLYGSLVVGANEALRFGNDTSGQMAGFRNKLINGGMGIWQRSTSISSGIGTSTPVAADRWIIYAEGAALNVTRVAGVGDSKYALNVSGAAGNTGWGVSQRIEAADIYMAAGSPITVSLWFYTSVPRDLFAIFYAPTTEDTWSGQTTEGSVSFGSLSAGWSKLTATFTSTENMKKGVGLNFGSSTLLTSGNIAFSEVQLEQGSIATPFENRPIGLELSMCQRYYETGTVQYIGYSSDLIGGWASFAQHKRTTPTITLTSPEENQNLGAQTISPRLNGFRLHTNVLVVGTAYYTGPFKAVAEL
jgi:hypothetical protein